jgi:NADPH:quinone reductase-like Zn-dependent oxidoreductase
MRALRLHAYGDPLRLEEAPSPAPAAGQLLVRVTAASVNPIDWKMAAGLLAKVFPVSFPRILGRDCAGQTDSGGLVAGVADPRGDGTHAQYTLLSASQCAPVPKGVSAEEAASLCVAGLSAWIPLVEIAKVAPGQRVLIHAGAGGVGSLAIQIARHLGAEVVTTASPGNHEYCRKLGAHAVLDYNKKDEILEQPRFDTILDTVGGEVHRRSLQALKPGATMVALSAAPVPPGTFRNDARVVMAQIQATRARLEQIFRWAASGVLKPQISKRFRLADGAQAYAASQSGHVRGKLLLLPE